MFALRALNLPLFKIPFLLWDTWLISRAMSPSTPPPNVNETKKSAGNGDPISLFAKASGYSWRVRIQVGTYWILTLGECCRLCMPYISCGGFSSAVGIKITYSWLAGCILMYSGATLRLACYHTLGEFFTWELVVKNGHKLITDGPYSIVRHPGYSAVWMIAIGELLSHFGPGSWYAECVGWRSLPFKVFASGWIFYCILQPATLMTRVNKEDAILQGEFGDEWEVYAMRTPWRLIPYIY